jgi:uncharacterized protein
MHPPHVAAVMIHVPEPDAALDWYEQAFPAALRVCVGEPPFELLRVGAIQIEIVCEDEKVNSGPAGTVIYWEVEALDVELARLIDIGATLYRGPMSIENGQSMCQVQDPWGNCLGLRGPLAATQPSVITPVAASASIAS